ncbi:MAG: dephospho-CoA kinase [Nitrospirae bacterium]|nr:dephospho-CoA kinase [Nitrospirota bacterium]
MGKSTVLSIFGKLGAVTIDADRIVGDLLKEKKILDKIKLFFGSGVFDAKGRLDKEKVSEKIFKDTALRFKLEGILHPLVFERINDFIKKVKDRRKIFIVEASLIYERGYENRFDRIITVFTNKKTAINRLAEYGVTPKIAKQRLGCQLPIEKKIWKADFKIDNNGTIEDTKSQVKEIYKRISEEARVNDLILHGKVREASRLLGRPYFIEGRVIKGAGRGGKLLHTPTANIAIQPSVSLKEGVYAVRVGIRPFTSASGGLPIYNGVANIGKNPTFGASSLSYEVHIFNFSGNLIGKKLRIYFIDRLRDEKKFPLVKVLETQIKKDIRKAKEILAHEKT